MKYDFFITLSHRSLIIGDDRVSFSRSLRDSGCNDSIRSGSGVVTLRYAREASSLGHAIESAVAAIERAGLVPRRIEIIRRVPRRIDIDQEPSP